MSARFSSGGMILVLALALTISGFFPVLDAETAEANSTPGTSMPHAVLSAELAALLEDGGENESLTVGIWLRPVDIASVQQRVAKNYPDLLVDGVRAIEQTDMELYEKFYMEFLAELRKDIELAGAPLAEYLSSLGHASTFSSNAPILFTEMPFSEVPLLMLREEVSFIEYAGGRLEAAQDSAGPTVRPQFVWSQYTRGSGRTVAVVDCGRIDFAHTALPSGSARLPTGAKSNHATMIAGVVASRDATYKGIAPEVGLLSANMFSDGGCSQNVETSRQAWINSVGWSIDNYAHVVTSSLLEDTDGSMTITDRYADHVAFNLGRLVVQAAGNRAPGTECPDTDAEISSPGLGFNVLTVGGIDDKNTAHWRGDGRYTCSSYEEYTHTEKPELSAPAVSITSTRVDGGWDTGTGTSMAAPAVAGTVALLIADSSWLTTRPELTKAILMASATHNVYGPGVIDTQEGVGTINVNQAFRTLKNGWYSYGTLSNLALGQHHHWTVYAEANEVVRIVFNYLSHVGWSSPWGNDGLNSNLDMYVYSPQGTLVATSATSSIFEVVKFVAPTTGSYDVDIYVQSIPGGDDFEYYGLAWNRNPSFVFTGNIQRWRDSNQHSFLVPFKTEDLYVRLNMPGGTDFDLSVWDYYGQRTGGWTSTDPVTRKEIPNSEYSGYGASPEWVWVSPSVGYPLEVWYVGLYAYSGSGTYTITVYVY